MCAIEELIIIIIIIIIGVLLCVAATLHIEDAHVSWKLWILPTFYPFFGLTIHFL